LKKSNADLVALGKALDNRNAQLRKKLDEAGSRNVGDNTLAFTGLA
jgi:hypothetical protein